MHTRSSYIRKSAFSHGNGHAVGIYESERIEFHDNVFFSFSTIGMKFEGSSDLVLENNVVVNIWERDFNQSMLLDTRAGYMMGDGPGLDAPPKNVTMKNNGAIGVFYAGFVAPGSSCGDDAENDDTMVSGNYAHSVHGEGWIGFKNNDFKDQETCMQVGYFEAWKTTGAAVVTVAKTKKVILTRIVSLDTGKGLIGNQVGISGDELETWIQDSYIQAESEVVRDCPKQFWCDSVWAIDPEDEDPRYTWLENAWENDSKYTQKHHRDVTCIDKLGTKTPVHLQSAQDPVLTQSFMLPVEGVNGDSAFAGTAFYYNVTFKGFESDRPYCGGERMRAISFNEEASDIVPLIKMTECTFIDTSDIGFIHMFQPPQSWITVRQCGSFPCTGPLNTAVNFFRTNFEGERQTASSRNFQIIPNNAVLAKQFSSCKWMPTWNGYHCSQSDYGVLHFESADDDAGKRNLYPVTVAPITD